VFDVCTEKLNRASKYVELLYYKIKTKHQKDDWTDMMIN
jgi:hypothetical protein